MELAKKLDEFKSKLEISKCKYWWHYFLAINEKDQQERPFFIQYYVLNPKSSSFEPDFLEPSYAMVRVGTWDDGGIQVSNFYGGNYFNIRNYDDKSEIIIGNCIVSDEILKGKVYLGKKCSELHNEFRSNSGEFLWEIEKNNRVGEEIENSIISLASTMKRFTTDYKGFITYNGERYTVRDSNSGYEIKASLKTEIKFLISINCNFFTDDMGENQESSLNLISLAPIVFKKTFDKEFYLNFKLEGVEYKYSTGVFGHSSINKIECGEDEDRVWMKLIATNENSRIDIHFHDLKKNIIKLFSAQLNNYGNMKYVESSAYAKGWIKLYEKQGERFILNKTLRGNRANIMFLNN